MADQATCGQGLAEHAQLPAKLGELTACVAENLEVHMRLLDLSDATAKEEHGVYERLAAEHREIAAQLKATAEDMSSYADLPMGGLDPRLMVSPKAVEAFARFVKLEQELLALLEERMDHDQQMLVEMGFKSAPPSRERGAPATSSRR